MWLVLSFSAPRPNLDKYVFLSVNQSTECVLVEEETLDTGWVVKRGNNLFEGGGWFLSKDKEDVSMFLKRQRQTWISS